MHQERIIPLLSNLGSIAYRRGDDTQAEAYYHEGLLLARQIGHQEHMSILLSNLGEAVARQENYQQAENYFQEGLADSPPHRPSLAHFLYSQRTG